MRRVGGITAIRGAPETGFTPSRGALEAGLQVFGEEPHFQERGPGHFQHRCTVYRASVNFWPSTGWWNVQGAQSDVVNAALKEHVSKLASVGGGIVPAGGQVKLPNSHPASIGDAADVADTAAAIMPAKEASVGCSAVVERVALHMAMHKPVKVCPDVAASSQQGSLPKPASSPAGSSAIVLGQAVVLAQTNEFAKTLSHEGRIMSDKRNESCFDLADRVRAAIGQSFSMWRGRQREVMHKAYEDFCAARRSVCEGVWRSAAERSPVPPELQTLVDQWHAQERRGLESCYTQWEQAETTELGMLFSKWQAKICPLLETECARLREELHATMLREQEAWRRTEGASLRADLQASRASKLEQQALQQELVEARQLLRRANEERDTAKRQASEALLSAERAAADLRNQQKNLAEKYKTKPVFSTRAESLTKRVRVEHDARLAGFGGGLLSKINQARAAGTITSAEADCMHQTRKIGNLAAHEPEGFFGTQVGPTVEAWSGGNAEGDDVTSTYMNEDDDDEDSSGDGDWNSFLSA